RRPRLGHLRRGLGRATRRRVRSARGRTRRLLRPAHAAQARGAARTRRRGGLRADRRWPFPDDRPARPGGRGRRGGVPALTAMPAVGALALDVEETELLRLLADGLVLDAVARRLGVSERTVRRRIRALCDRFDVDTSVQVV